MDKKDEQELKEWKEKNLNYIENYGVDIYEKGKKKKNSEKIINFINKIIKIILIIFAIAVAVFIVWLLLYRWQIVYDKVHIDPKETIEVMYDTKINEVSKNLDSNSNGSYVYEIKNNPEIKFNVIVKWASMNEDYADNCQKYFYEHWQNTNKDIIQTNISYYEDAILKYEQYVQIENEDEIENAVKIMYDFISSAENYFSPDWNLYLKLNDGYRIYPFDYYNIDLNTSINKAKAEYLKRLENNNLNEIKDDSTQFLNEI